jgi:hypothetical protein
MPMQLLLPNNATYELYDRDRGNRLMGYVFSSAGTGDPPNGSDQIQRWILFDNEPKCFFPPRALLIRPALADPWRTIFDKRTFITMARLHFRRGSDIYVKANCRYTTGEAPLTRPLKEPPLLDLEPGGYQADIGTCPIVMPEQNNTTIGYLYSPKPEGNLSKEYWVLFSEYTSPTAENPLQVGGRLEFDIPSTFVSLFDRGDVSKWTAACTLMVAWCQRYEDMPGVGDNDIPMDRAAR